MKVRKRRLARGKAGSINEFAAVLMLISPVVLLAIFVEWYVAQYYIVKTTLNHAAQVAARRLAIRYGQNPRMAMAFPQATFRDIKMMGIVNSPKQFRIPAGSKGWNVNTEAPTVTVQVEYQNGKYGPSLMPNFEAFGFSTATSIAVRCTNRLE